MTLAGTPGVWHAPTPYRALALGPGQDHGWTQPESGAVSAVLAVATIVDVETS